MTTAIDYALMAGASYVDTRRPINQFPTPQNWVSFNHQSRDSGFEAVSFVKGTDIVISFSGTDPGDLFGDVAADLALSAGILSVQLKQAADYYLQVKAANAGATISFTGHSLGGGLASLMAVMFGESAFTFDQAPFLNSAKTFIATDFFSGNTTTSSVAKDLRAYLTGRAPDAMLVKLDAYIAAADPSNLNPNPADSLAARGGQVTNLSVQGEVLSAASALRIGTELPALQHGDYFHPFDLHSQALLSAFVQSDQTATTTVVGQKQSLSQVTYKLTDLLGMIFDKKLFAFDTDTKNATNPNFLELIVNHEAGRDPKTNTAITADTMVTRFTKDLWKLAQDGGLTMSDRNPLSPQLNDVSKTLMAFVMQKYYEETSTSAGYKKEFFTDLGTAGTGSNGVQFDMADVSTKFATAFQKSDRLDFADAKGFALYFKNYLQSLGSFSDEERELIQSTLPNLRYWCVQAGAGAMVATDTLNRGAFMLGGSGADSLTGGSVADLLVGNRGDDILFGASGSDVLVGGLGNDSYKYTTGDGLDTILDSDGQGNIQQAFVNRSISVGSVVHTHNGTSFGMAELMLCAVAATEEIFACAA